jgi:hypothetical protein
MSEVLGGFNSPRPAQDSYIVREYEALGIGSEPSLEAIEPHAIEMLRQGKILEGIQLVLGRRIDAKDTQTDPTLAGIYVLALQTPEEAFGALLLKVATDELASEG